MVQRASRPAFHHIVLATDFFTSKSMTSITTDSHGDRNYLGLAGGHGKGKRGAVSCPSGLICLCVGRNEKEGLCRPELVLLHLASNKKYSLNDTKKKQILLLFLLLSTCFTN